MSFLLFASSGNTVWLYLLKMVSFISLVVVIVKLLGHVRIANSLHAFIGIVHNFHNST